MRASSSVLFYLRLLLILVGLDLALLADSAFLGVLDHFWLLELDVTAEA